MSKQIVSFNYDIAKGKIKESMGNNSFGQLSENTSVVVIYVYNNGQKFDLTGYRADGFYTSLYGRREDQVLEVVENKIINTIPTSILKTGFDEWQLNCLLSKDQYVIDIPPICFTVRDTDGASGIPTDNSVGILQDIYINLSEIKNRVNDTYSKEEVYTKTEVYTKEEVDQKVSTGGSGGGSAALPDNVPLVYVSTTRPENLRPIDIWIETKEAI